MPKPVKVKNTLRMRSFAIIEEAVERGVRYALQRAVRGKEEATPETVTRSVMSELCDVIAFEEE